MSNFPEWAKPGETVLVVTSRYGDRTARECTISRLTNTRIMVKNSYGSERAFVPARFGDGEWEEYGGRSGYTTPARLIHASSPESERVYAQMKHKALVVAAMEACSSFRNTRTVASARETIKALQSYIESGQAK